MGAGQSQAQEREVRRQEKNNTNARIEAQIAEDLRKRQAQANQNYINAKNRYPSPPTYKTPQQNNANARRQKEWENNLSTLQQNAARSIEERQYQEAQRQREEAIRQRQEAIRQRQGWPPNNHGGKDFFIKKKSKSGKLSYRKVKI